MSIVWTKQRLIAAALTALFACAPAVYANADAGGSSTVHADAAPTSTTATTPPDTAPSATAASPTADSAGAPVSVDKDGKVILKGSLSETLSPIAADGSNNVLPEGTKFSLTMLANINSELSKVGDDVVAMVSLDMKDGGKVLLPGQWCVHGKVSEVAGRRRLGRDGYVTVKFDKLVSPDGRFQVPIDATASTHDSTAKAVAKVVAKDSVYVTRGAVAGAITSVQITGIPLAIASHGYSVAGGAAIGATIGLIGALKRKGNIACGLRGEEVQFRLDQPVTLPAFNAEALPSAVPVPHMDDLDIVVEHHRFVADPSGDRGSRLLSIMFKVDNKTNRSYSFSNIVVVSDHNHMYYPYALSLDAIKQRGKSVSAKSSQEATITFGVDSPKRKYWLVLMDHGNSEELTRVPVN